MCYGVVFGKEVQDDGKLGSNLGNSNTRPAGGEKTYTNITKTHFLLLLLTQII